MPFYSSISRYYDEIFPTDDAEMAFVEKLLAGCKAVLDVGCGTGNKTELLAAAGRSITALDSDLGMIAVAREKHAARGIKYRALGMQSIGTAFSKGSFDALLCLGNTLAHLTDPQTIRKFLHDSSLLLQPGALAVIQILNYEKILAEKLESLPLVETANLTFTRRYAWQGRELRFLTTLFVKDSGEVLESDIPLYPLQKRELDEMLDEAGFSQARYYGSYQGDPLTDQSLPLIVTARKA